MSSFSTVSRLTSTTLHLIFLLMFTLYNSFNCLILRTYETQIHESTLIYYFPELLHMNMISESSTHLFALFCNLVKLPCTNPGSIWRMDETTEIIPDFPSFCYVWFTVKPCKMLGILSVFINIGINEILWWTLHCKIDWWFPKKNQTVSLTIACHHPFIFKFYFLLYLIKPSFICPCFGYKHNRWIFFPYNFYKLLPCS